VIVAVRRRVHLPYLGLGVLLMVLGAIVFGIWGSPSSAKRPVLVAAHEISAGSVISRDDLRAVNASVDAGAAVIDADNLDRIVGKRAAVTVPEGALLAAASVRDGPALQPGEAIVSVLLAPGAAPVPDLQIGDHVAVVAAATSKTGAAGTAGVLATAEVVAVTPLRQGSSPTGSVSVSLRVPTTSAVDIADANAAQRVSLVLIAPDETINTQGSGG
jgi:Flp pilus assembly protein CpaB